MAVAGASTAGAGLTRERIISRALELLHTHGLPDLSMRRLATELGVKPGALYWHIASKQELLAEMSKMIVVQTKPDPPAGGHDSLETARPSLEAAWLKIANDLRAALLAYRDGAEVVSSSYALGLLQIPALELLVQHAVQRGGGQAQARRGARSIIHYTIGQVFHQQQLEFAQSLGISEVKQPPDDAEIAHDFAMTISWIAMGVQSANN